MRVEHEPVIVQYLNGSSQETLTLSGFVNLSLKTNILKQTSVKDKKKCHIIGENAWLGDSSFIRS